ncbi:MAG: hypothetical protein LBJ64_04155 [Deltaproteobacteria bacterium]|jgi:hypothetical protein|nr:hypothetical protein [Deltaproteobacteria bacterium]
MQLSNQHRVLFFRIMYNLIWGINENRLFVPRYQKPGRDAKKTTPPMAILEVNEAMWDDPTLIEEYLADKNIQIPDEEREIVDGWNRRHIKASFMVVDHLPKYSVFMKMDTPPLLYGVLGLSDPISKMYPFAKQFLTKATLLPLKGQIVTDGILKADQTEFNQETKEDIEKLYRMGLKSRGVIERLDDDLLA